MANASPMSLHDLRNNIDFATVTQFLHIFQFAFKPWPQITDNYQAFLNAHRLQPDDDYVFATEDFEEMFLDPGKSVFLEDLIVRMLRTLTRNRLISASTWQRYLAREFDKRVGRQDNPFRAQHDGDDDEKKPINDVKKEESDVKAEDEHDDEPVAHDDTLISFYDLPMTTRLQVLHELCEWQLDSPERLREHLDDEDQRSWRVDPVGFDAKGDTYWLFDDNRLYVESEEPPKKKPKKKAARRRATPKSRRNTRATRGSVDDADVDDHDGAQDQDEDDAWVPWKMMCMSSDDWKAFPARFADSQHVDERRFYKLLTGDLVERVLPAIEENEMERAKKQQQAARKRSSRIMVRELEALEQQQINMAMRASAADGEPELSRSEKRRLQREQEEKERQSRARQERAMERERKLAEQRELEELMATKANLERERRLLQRTGAYFPNDSDELDITSTAPDFPLLETPVAEPVVDDRKKKKGKKDKKDNNAKGKKDSKKPRKKKATDDANGEPPKKRKRRTKAQMLADAQKDEEDDVWMFRCLCGVQGQNLDDGEPMVACEKCSEWQHMACLQKSHQIPTNAAALEAFTFVCHRCLSEEERMDVDIDSVADNASRPPLQLKLQLQSPSTQPLPRAPAPAPVSTPPPPQHHAPHAPFYAHANHPPMATPARPPYHESHAYHQNQPHHHHPYRPTAPAAPSAPMIHSSTQLPKSSTVPMPHSGSPVLRLPALHTLANAATQHMPPASDMRTHVPAAPRPQLNTQHTSPPQPQPPIHASNASQMPREPVRPSFAPSDATNHTPHAPSSFPQQPVTRPIPSSPPQQPLTRPIPPLSPQQPSQAPAQSWTRPPAPAPPVSTANGHHHSQGNGSNVVKELVAPSAPAMSPPTLPPIQLPSMASPSSAPNAPLKMPPAPSLPPLTSAAATSAPPMPPSSSNTSSTHVSHPWQQ
ncbi:hypothetical protein BC940DRAFT_305433 [Gongronella butleri]|nr:hypothetical protein BC940DRAFT_305433 [Gongronella butleri]